jgi:hypothetical protein
VTTPTLASAAVVPGPPLAWEPATLQPGADGLLYGPSFAVAPGDGTIAYGCAPPDAGATNAHTYTSRDRAATWTRGGDLPVGAQPQGGKPFQLECDIAVDASNPATAVVTTRWGQVGANAMLSQYASFASFDFGAHWRELTPAQPLIVDGQMASWNGSIYAIGVTQIPGGNEALWVSADQMRTWRRVNSPADANALGAGHTTAFWLNSASGSLLMVNDSVLLESDDHAQTWATLDPVGAGWMIGAPQVGHPWRFCRATGAPHDPQPLPTGALACSADGGRTWTVRPAVLVPTVSPKGVPSYIGTAVFAIAGDGALLATMAASLASSTGTRVYRLPEGTTVWQDLGPLAGVPYPFPRYYPTPTGGVIWFEAGGRPVSASDP